VAYSLTIRCQCFQEQHRKKERRERKIFGRWKREGPNPMDLRTVGEGVRKVFFMINLIFINSKKLEEAK
jgi:hypothetical protein